MNFTGLMIGVLLVGLIATLVINYSLSKENKSLERRLEWKRYGEYDTEKATWMELTFLRNQVSQLMKDRVTNTVYAFVAVCMNQHFVGITTKASNEKEAYGYAHELVKEKFGTDDMVLNVYTLWIPGVNSPSEEVPEEKEE